MPDPASTLAAPRRPAVTGAVIAAFRFVSIAWRKAWPVLLIACGTFGLLIELAARRTGGPWPALAVLAVCVAVIKATSSLCDVAFGREVRAARWGAQEWRVAGALGLIAPLGLVLALLLTVLLLALTYGVAAVGGGFVASDPASWGRAIDGRGRWIIRVVAVIGAAAVLWALVRVAFAPLATVAKGRIQVLSTWALTRGRVLRLVAALVWVALTPAALLFAIWTAGRLARPGEMWAGAAAAACEGLVVAGLWLPLKVGVISYFYPREDADSPS